MTATGFYLFTQNKNEIKERHYSCFNLPTSKEGSEIPKVLIFRLRKGKNVLNCRLSFFPDIPNSHHSIILHPLYKKIGLLFFF